LGPPLRAWIGLEQGRVPQVMPTSPSDEPFYLSAYHPPLVSERQRSSYLSALEGIGDELQSLSDRSSAAGYQENDSDAHAVSELTENLRDAILEYQVSTDFERLRSFARYLLM